MRPDKIRGPFRRFHEAVHALDISQELFGQAIVTLEGTGSVRIEGHRGILSYEDDQILVAAKDCVIRFCGRGLRLALMDRDDIRIVGTIASVEYVRGDRK
ncbi:MAG: YabP/YqfC family sporulation protein [Clostridia bacterium]|nr:YabP/YqfC family sporulation protein [Clostridia bacterium]